MAGVRAPRIYNLFPLLAGPIDEWHRHLPHIAGMGFDWVFLNPFHYPGFSGSLYAIKDFDRLHPVIAGVDDGWERPLAAFCDAADDHGIAVMVDLVINHMAKDALLVDEHPEWFKRSADGAIKSPHVVDPTDPRRITEWGDLGEIDYDNTEHREAQIAYWSGLIRRYRTAGVRGFRCDAAYKVPASIWRPLIHAAKNKDAGVVVAAETLGCTPEQAKALAPAGFDLFFNSAKWWDFRSRWLLDQYELYRSIAPTVAFPESHDTPRLITELELTDPAEAEARYRFAYGFAASFSAGVMITMGFEYGFSQALDVKATRPGQWAAERGRRPFDLSGFIADMNAVKAATPALGEEAPQRRISSPDAGYVALARGSRDGPRALTLFNPAPHEPAAVDPSRLIQATGDTDFRDRTPGRTPVTLVPGEPLHLSPLEFRIFAQPEDSKHARTSRTAGASEAPDPLECSGNRVAIEKVAPEIDGGRFPIKRIVGERLRVEADIFCDGHDALAAAVQYRMRGTDRWCEAPMRHYDNDRWRGSIPLTELGRLEYRIVAWRDRYRTLAEDIAKKLGADQAVDLELAEGEALLAEAHDHAAADDRYALGQWRTALADGDPGSRLAHFMDPRFAELMERCEPRRDFSVYERPLVVVIDRPKAVFSSWYELFPRSQSGDGRRHGTFRDVIAHLPYVRDLGFDVLYLTPIHPIGHTDRKGRNNALTAGPDDPGSVYAIGSEAGGHKAVHPQLGGLDGFRELVAAARGHGLEIALDIAVQCSPDHPWLVEHPEWFDWRPDGSIRHAENPPKRYEDIVNVHFYRDALPGLWHELKSVFDFWIEQGVKLFRVDNPHTKPLPFWEWLIDSIKRAHPEVLFLSEAFTRPKMMERLAKLGFCQSYTYFIWRTTKAEMTEYLSHLTAGEVAEVFRPNFFINTPDINPPELQSGERPAYIKRLVLAATLSGNYGIYNGFEICEGTPLPGKDEYLDSEKYEIKAWDLDRAGNIKDWIRRLNTIRRDNPALWQHGGLQFLNAWNEEMLCYLKLTPERDNAIVVMVNMDHRNAHQTDFEVPLWEFDLPDDASIDVEDLLEDYRFSWTGKTQHVRIDPAHSPARIWRLVPRRGAQ